jgi:hypothetical protein
MTLPACPSWPTNDAVVHLDAEALGDLRDHTRHLDVGGQWRVGARLIW